MYKCKIYYWNGWTEELDFKEISVVANNYAAAMRYLYWATELEEEDIEKIEIERIE